MAQAIGYIRISTKDQSRFSLQAQSQYITEYAQRNNIEVLNIFEDDGKSAKNFDRPDWKNLEQFVKQNHGKIDTLIVAKFDRFSRNLREALNMIELLESKYNILVVSVFEQIGLHPKNPRYFEYRAHSLLNATVELANIKERTKMGIRRANNGGEWVNKPPFGYERHVNELGKRTLKINLTNANTIKTIFDLFIGGASIKDIAKQAGQMGYKAKHKSAIRRILENVAYLGQIKVAELYDEPMQIKKALHDAIIDETTFYKAQQLLNPARPNKTFINDNFPLRGVLECNPCGKKLTAAFSTGKTKKVGYYFCTVDRQYNFNSTVVHTKLQELLNTLSLPSSYISYLKDKTYQLLKENLADRDRVIAEKKQEITKVEARLKTLQYAFLDQQIPPTDYKELSMELNKEKSIHTAYISGIQTPIEKLWITYNQQLSRLGNIAHLYNGATILQQQQFLRLVFERGISYFEGCFRTPQILPIFATQAPLLLQKKLLIIEQPHTKIKEIDFSTPHLPTFELLTLLSNIKTA